MINFLFSLIFDNIPLYNHWVGRNPLDRNTKCCSKQMQDYELRWRGKTDSRCNFSAIQFGSKMHAQLQTCCHATSCGVCVVSHVSCGTSFKKRARRENVCVCVCAVFSALETLHFWHCLLMFQKTESGIFWKGR